MVPVGSNQEPGDHPKKNTFNCAFLFKFLDRVLYSSLLYVIDGFTAANALPFTDKLQMLSNVLSSVSGLCGDGQDAGSSLGLAGGCSSPVQVATG